MNTAVVPNSSCASLFEVRSVNPEYRKEEDEESPWTFLFFVVLLEIIHLKKRERKIDT